MAVFVFGGRDVAEALAQAGGVVPGDVSHDGELESDGSENNELMATRDLTVVDTGLLAAHGGRRGRRYSASDSLLAASRMVRAARPPRTEIDPFAVSPEQMRFPREG